MRLFFSFVLIMALAYSSGAATGETAASTQSATSTLTPILPHCVEEKKQVDAILTGMKTNSDSELKYDEYRKALSSDSDTELVARLAYSETPAANCPQQIQARLCPLIAEAIANRVHIRKDDVRSVVFQRNQFASSLNNYAESRFHDFLCPKDNELWKICYARAQAEMNKSASNQLADDSVYYFLYKHNPKWTEAPMDGKYKEDTSIVSPALRSCIRFWHDPKWKGKP